MSNERPILFSGPMVRAIFADTKTQTRRLDGLEVINRKPDAWRYGGAGGYVSDNTPQYWEWFDNTETGDDVRLKCPYWPRQRRWVREAFCYGAFKGCPMSHPGYLHQCLYAADEGLERFPISGNWTQRNADFKWRPSIHMPRWASRLTLEIVSVRVERVQDISAADAIAEGVLTVRDWKTPDGAVGNFARLWDSINAPRGYGWQVNPWVWAIEFRRVTTI